ncbi:peptide ABC transporter substrate-binding protein [Simkania sp.]|uniref:peptide ABC transporter substrate-binding protein n=1 Tax=Simkania sp. TaxID=34094 RepID=UPI003B528054
METTKSFEISSPEDLDICPVFSFYQRNEGVKELLAQTKRTLLHVLPKPMPFNDQKGLEEWLKKSLPIFTYTECEPAPSIVTVRFFSKPLCSLPTETFLQEMIKRWLIPHSETTISSFHHMQFYFEHYLKEPFFVGEAQILVKSAKEHNLIKMNLPLLQKEILSAVTSGSYAKSILETKALPIDRKAFLVRESLLRLIHRFPDEFDDQILHRFAFAQAYTSDEFKDQRSFPHLTRMITSMYLIRNRLERELRTLPEKRHMILRFIQTKLSFAFGKKPVLGMVIGLNFFHQFEFFEEKHILLSVQKFFPHMRLVSGSFHRFQPSQSPIVTIYVELEKEDGSRFFPREVRTLREHLTDELSKRIEHLVPSLFMVRNEEEIMRNILLLSQELKRKGDLPQMMISFDQHSQEDLIFTVVLLRVKDQNSRTLEELLDDVDPKIRYIPDRVQNVRYLDKDHPIEANVFRLQIAKLPIFLRMDFSVNLYLARQEVVTFLTRQLGELRDYNGGMILKQGELLAQFKRLFQDLSARNQELLENFFYSLNPIEAQATISLNCLSFFFDLFLGLADKEFPKKADYDLDIEQTDGGKFAVMRASEPDYRTIVEEELKSAGIYDRSIVSSILSFEGSHYLGYYLSTPTEEKAQQFAVAVRAGLEKWASSRQKLKVLRLATTYDVCLDPRIGGDLESSVFIKLLFEGLMRRGLDGAPECASAESYTLSDDKLRYTFKIRESFWSDGSPLVAYDFEYAWKKILSPSFSTPFTSLFRPIRNAKDAKDGLVSLDEVGVKATDDRTLVVDLEYQAPYFIELTAHTLYSPINHRIEKMHPNWSTQKDHHFICNGPFKLRANRPMYNCEMERNPYYWRNEKIFFDQVLINKTKDRAILDMFKKQEVDYVGVPFNPLDRYWDDLRNQEIYSQDSGVLFWLCLNTDQFPFTNVNMRRALASALNRNEIFKSYFVSNDPSYTVLPRHITQHLDSDATIKEDAEQARAYFKQALKELNIKKEDIPVITLIYSHESQVRNQIVESIKSQWEEVLGIKSRLESYEWRNFFSQMTTGRYQVGMLKWHSWFKDPIYTLNAFKYREEGINFSRWENPEFQKLLRLSDQEKDTELRLQYLAEAEGILLKESPVIPLSYDKSCFAKNPRLEIHSNTFSQDGHYDFTQTSLSTLTN